MAPLGPAPRPRRLPRWLAPLLRVLAVLSAALLCSRWLRHLDWQALLGALRGARVPLVAAAGLLTYLNVFCAAERWRIMLAPTARIPRWPIWKYCSLSAAVSLFLPARGGEALRLYLPQRHGVPASTSLGVLLVERIFDWQGMLAIYLPLPFLLTLAPAVKTAIALIAAVALAALVLALWLAGRIRRRAPRSGSFWARLDLGLDCVRRPRSYAVVLFWSIGQFVVEVVQIHLLIRGVGIGGLPWAAPGLVLLTLNLAIIVPLTPGHLGTFEAGVVAGLRALGAPLAPAMAVALLYHAVQAVPVLLAGLLGLPAWLEGGRGRS